MNADGFNPYIPKAGDEIIIDLFGLYNNPSGATVIGVFKSGMVIRIGLGLEEYVQFGSDRVYSDNLEDYWRKCVIRAGERIVALRRECETLEEQHKRISDIWLAQYNKRTENK
jgi:hypothetical protein